MILLEDSFPFHTIEQLFAYGEGFYQFEQRFPCVLHRKRTPPFGGRVAVFHRVN